MTIQNIINFELLSYYDQKIKNWIKALKASSSQDGLMSKEDYSKLEGIQNGAQPNVIEGISVNGSTVIPDGNKKVNIEVPTDFYSQNEVDTKDTSVLQNILGKIWSNKKGDDSGNFQTKYNHADGSYALMWNESDGGGAQYYNKANDKLAFVGVNDGGANGIYAQIYAKGKADNTGVRINVTPNGAYYNIMNGISTDPRYEIATKGDIQTVSGEIPTTLSAFTNDTGFLTEAEVQSKIDTAVTAAVVYRGSVSSYENLPSSNNRVGDMWDVMDSDYNYIWNGSDWDPTSKIIVIETASISQIESLFD